MPLVATHECFDFYCILWRSKIGKLPMTHGVAELARRNDIGFRVFPAIRASYQVLGSTAQLWLGLHESLAIEAEMLLPFCSLPAQVNYSDMVMK